MAAHPKGAKARDALGATPLHRAAGGGSWAAAEALLAAGAQLEALDARSATPLLLAAASGRREVALRLAARGADVEAEDDEGETPLGAAAAASRPLREALAQLAKGETTLDDLLEEE